MKTTDAYSQVIQKTTGMVRDAAVQHLAEKHGLHVLDVTWEDTARFDFSAVGPNISDMTIQVQHQLPGREDYELACMPVIRYPNFSDVSGDISPDEFFLLVGNEQGQPLEKITLRQLLGNLRAYLHDPQSWKGDRNSLLAGDRDSHVLVSAQACFLPIPKDGIAEFNPVLFNYQSRAGDPAVLTILATREGTSITVIDNVRDGFDAGRTWGQRLFFNQNGERASLTGQRKSDFVAERQVQQETVGATEEQADREGLNMVLLIQVPLKQKEPIEYRIFAESDDVDAGGVFLSPAIARWFNPGSQSTSSARAAMAALACWIPPSCSAICLAFFSESNEMASSAIVAAGAGTTDGASTGAAFVVGFRLAFFLFRSFTLDFTTLIR
jgi:hypothetical protein